MTQFSDLGLNKNTLATLDGLGYENPTEIQEKTIPYFWIQIETLLACPNRNGENNGFYFL